MSIQAPLDWKPFHHSPKRQISISSHYSFLQPPTLGSRQPVISFTSLMICLSWTLHINGTEYVHFCDWLLLPSIIFKVHLYDSRYQYFILNNIYCMGVFCSSHHQLIITRFNKVLRLFSLLAGFNNASINMCVWVKIFWVISFFTYCLFRSALFIFHIYVNLSNFFVIDF